jgi:hypothetical protein
MVWSDLWRSSSGSRSAQPSWSGLPPTLLLSVRPGAPPPTLTSTGTGRRSGSPVAGCPARAANSETGSANSETGSMAAARACLGARLPDFVGAVESGASDDVSGHGVEWGPWEGMGMGPAQPRWPRAPLPCLSPPIGLGWVRPFSGMACSAGSMPRVSAWVAGFPNGTSGSCTMSTSSAVPAGGVVQARAGEMLAPKSRPRCRCGMGAPCSKAGLVRAKLSGACRSGRAQTRVWWPARLSVAQCVTERVDGHGRGSLPRWLGGAAGVAECAVED